MLSLEDALGKFELLEPEVIFIVNSDRFTNAIKELSEKYGVDLNAAVLYSVVGDLKPEELPEYLMQEKELAEDQAKAIATELIEKVLKPMEIRLLFLNNDPDKSGITPAQEKDELRKIFSENLVSEMSENFIIKNALNQRMFNILDEDINFKRDLERLIYENKEHLTEKLILLYEKPIEPTVGNWLKDFIQKKGADNFNAVSLSDYMTNSQNTKNLSAEEKQKVIDLLNLYRNLKFFPENVAGKPMEDWQIIPFDPDEVKKFIEMQKSLGEEEEEEIGMTIDQKLSRHDWSNIVGIERRALLEELGVSLNDFVKWQANKSVK